MLHTDFPHDYEIIPNPELPGDGRWKIPELYVPKGFEPKPHPGHLLLKVKTSHKQQIWHVDSWETSDAWTTPDPCRILISSTDGALYVSVTDPEDVLTIKCYGIHITPINEQGVLLLNDYFGMIALDSSGVRWQTPGLFSDDLSIRAIDGSMIICSGVSLNNIDKEERIAVDISTGKVIKSDWPSVNDSLFNSLFSRLRQRGRDGKKS